MNIFPSPFEKPAKNLRKTAKSRQIVEKKIDVDFDALYNKKN